MDAEQATAGDGQEKRIRILIVDDHRLFRQGLRQICELKGGFEIVGEAEDGQEAVEMAHKLQPDIILMDVNMPGESGVSATRHIVQKDASARVIILTMHEEDQYLFEAIKAGAKGYLLKDTDWRELLDAVRTVYEEGAIIKPAMAERMMEEFKRLAEPPVQGAGIESLTAGEMGVLHLVAQGLENDAIAKNLSISQKTVANRLSEIYQKLHVNNRTQAALYALRQGWTTLEDEEGAV